MNLYGHVTNKVPTLRMPNKPPLSKHSCALCDSPDVVTTDTLAQGWDEYLANEHDYYPVGSHIQVPICANCKPEWNEYRHQFGYDSASKEEASPILDMIIIRNLLEFNSVLDPID